MLDRTRPGRKFRRITGAALTALLPGRRPRPRRAGRAGACRGRAAEGPATGRQPDGRDCDQSRRRGHSSSRRRQLRQPGRQLSRRSAELGSPAGRRPAGPAGRRGDPPVRRPRDPGADRGAGSSSGQRGRSWPGRPRVSRSHLGFVEVPAAAGEHLPGLPLVRPEDRPVAVVVHLDDLEGPLPGSTLRPTRSASISSASSTWPAPRSSVDAFLQGSSAVPVSWWNE